MLSQRGVDCEVRLQAKGDGYYSTPIVTLEPGEVVARIDEVATGTVRLEVSGAGLATEYLEIEVLSGEVTAVEVEARQGALVPIEIDLERVEGFRRVRYSVTSAEGQLLKSGNIALRSARPMDRRSRRRSSLTRSSRGIRSLPEHANDRPLTIAH